MFGAQERNEDLDCGGNLSMSRTCLSLIRILEYCWEALFCVQGLGSGGVISIHLLGLPSSPTLLCYSLMLEYISLFLCNPDL